MEKLKPTDRTSLKCVEAGIEGGRPPSLLSRLQQAQKGPRASSVTKTDRDEGKFTYLAGRLPQKPCEMLSSCGGGKGKAGWTASAVSRGSQTINQLAHFMVWRVADVNRA